MIFGDSSGRQCGELQQLPDGFTRSLSRWSVLWGGLTLLVLVDCESVRRPQKSPVKRARGPQTRDRHQSVAPGSSDPDTASYVRVR